MAKRCKLCKEYGPNSEMITRGTYTYCSDDCFQEHRQQLYKRQQGAARTTTRKRAAKKRKPTISKDLHDRILESDGYRCRYCGGSGPNLAVHHVHYRSEIRNKPWQDQPSNLITLHNMPCHLGIVHGNKEVYQPLCLQIIWLREIDGDRYTTIKKLEQQNDS